MPEAYYDYLRHAGESEEARRRGLYAKFPDEAKRASEEAWLAVLGKEDPSRVHARIVQALGNTADWVLIGGPPCQAYSLVGRAATEPGFDLGPWDLQFQLHKLREAITRVTT